MNSDSTPIANTIIELRNSDTGVAVQKTYPDARGGFDFSNVAPGQYTLCVTEGGQVVEQQVAVRPFDLDLRITMPRSSSTGTSKAQGATVSVSDLTIPAKAQQAFQSAQNALSKKDIAKATQHVEHALAITPKFPDALSLRAVLYLATGNAAMAIQAAKESTQLEHRNVLAYTILGASYNALGNSAEAAASLQEALSIDPNFWQSHFEMARCLYNQRKPSSALAELEKAAQSAPKNFAQVHLLRGAILIQLHHSSDASVELRRFIDGDPQSPEAAQAKQMLASLPSDGFR